MATTKYLGPLVPHLKSNLVYSESFAINPPLGGLASHVVFSANGLYNPNITLTGHQPRGFDQLMTMYDHYVVIASKITTWACLRNGNTAPQMMAITVLDRSTTSSLPDDIMERTLVQTDMLALNGSPRVKLDLGLNPNKFLGRSDPLSDPELKGSSSANPTEQAFFHVSCFPIQGVDAGIVDIHAQLEYTAVFIEPTQPVIS